jgi:hypothetical protein
MAAIALQAFWKTDGHNGEKKLPQLDTTQVVLSSLRAASE